MDKTKGNVDVVCAHCDTGFNIKLSRFNRSKSGLFFCNRDCKIAEQRIGGLITPNHYGTEKVERLDLCLRCNKPLVADQIKYCSPACSSKHRSEIKVHEWLNGTWDGSEKSGLSGTIREYILKQNKYTCSECGNASVNPYSGLSIIQVDHIDGDFQNNHSGNLRTLCPNCHAMTPNFGSLNKSGKGRRRVLGSNF